MSNHATHIGGRSQVMMEGVNDLLYPPALLLLLLPSHMTLSWLDCPHVDTRATKRLYFAHFLGNHVLFSVFLTCEAQFMVCIRV